MSYPKGAISSVEELVSHMGETLYRASNKFKTVSEYVITGNTGTERYRDHNDPSIIKEYHWLGVKYPGQDYEDRTSLVDWNITERNNYNDWFLFPSKEDAEAYRGELVPKESIDE